MDFIINYYKDFSISHMILGFQWKFYIDNFIGPII